MLAENHVGAGLLGFSFATFAICWAWINFTWFASAYDTDDWIYRLMTMLQMVGVIILALGFPQMYASIEHGDHVDNRVMVAGYVVMRIALVGQWLRAAKQDPRSPLGLPHVRHGRHRRADRLGRHHLPAHIGAGDVRWSWCCWSGWSYMGPWLAETRKGGTPWHAHHITERYGLLTIIALGEGVVGTVASLSAVVSAQGWSFDAVFVAVAGIGLTFGMWWTYFVVPQADLLHAHRERSFWFGYLHDRDVRRDRRDRGGSACGRVLHRAPFQARLGRNGVGRGLARRGVHRLRLRAVRMVGAGGGRLPSAAPRADGRSCWSAAVWLAGAGISMANCLLVVTLAPMVTVVGYETLGHRHAAEAIARSLAGQSDAVARLAASCSGKPTVWSRSRLRTRLCSGVKKAARVHVMPASAAANTRCRWRSTTMPKTTKSGTGQEE